MKVRKLYLAKCLENDMVVETENGESKKFNIAPFRNLKESDLKPVPYFKPEGENGTEAPSYMYPLYGLEKVE